MKKDSNDAVFTIQHGKKDILFCNLDSKNNKKDMQHGKKYILFCNLDSKNNKKDIQHGKKDILFYNLDSSQPVTLQLLRQVKTMKTAVSLIKQAGFAF